MRVLVIGASGFIGAAVVDRLRTAGHELVVAGRDAAALNAQWPDLLAVSIDFSAPLPLEALRGSLAGVHTVVNAVGVFAEQPENSFVAVHRDGPLALFQECLRIGVRHIVQISALGADAQAGTAFHRSKHDIDEQLLAMPIDSTVLMPSLVFGAHGASSRAFLGLALMPLLLLPGGGWQRVQPIHRDDLVDAIAAVVASGCGHGRLAMVGPRCITIAEYLSALRTGLGFSPPAVATLPAWAIRSANALRIGGGLLDREALAMLDRGNCADAGPIGALLGRAPRAPEQFVAGTRAMLRRETIVAAAMPLLRIALALMWIGSAFASWLYPRALSLELLHRSGVHGSSAVFALHAAAMLDLLLGAALFARSLRAPAYAAQLALMLGYTAWISVFLPEFWLHPYAPILKNVPIAVLTWFMWQMERRDGLPDA